MSCDDEKKSHFFANSAKLLVAANWVPTLL
jgi:hypothetical protein